MEDTSTDKDSKEKFFYENSRSVNMLVEKSLFACIAVPVSFIILTIPNIWQVPHKYSIFLICYTFSMAMIMHFLNKSDSKKIINLTIYFGLISANLFVDLMGVSGVITISITYACIPFLSCLYYNKRVMLITTIISYLSLLVVYWLRANTFTIYYKFIIEQTKIEWYISNILGVTIEYIFLTILTLFTTKKTGSTLATLILSFHQRNTAYAKLDEKNKQILKINNELESKNMALKDTQYRIIQFVSQVLGSHDLFTGRHVLHTRKYVEIIARQLQEDGYYTNELTDETIQLYGAAAFLHDIGKIHIPEGVLNKIGLYTADEFEFMKCHPEEGKKILEYLPPIEDGKFNDIAIKMAYYHHEKWDGTGYPNQLSGYDIPLCARIMTAADVLDALISQRLYKDAMSVEEAMELFRKASGTHFEPCIAQAVIENENLIKIIDQDFKISESTSNNQELEWWQHYHSVIKNEDLKPR